MNHAERKASERNAEDEHVRHQVGLQELRGIDEHADRRHTQSGGARDQQLPLPVRELRDGVVGGFSDSWHSFTAACPARPRAHRPLWRVR